MYFLNQRGVTRLDVVNYISHGISKVPKDKNAEGNGEQDRREDAPAGCAENHASQLNAQAKARQDRSDDGRPLHFSSAWCRCPARRRKNNPLPGR